MITRTLAEGWDFQINWRFLVAEQRLQEKPDATVTGLCDGEEDFVVRQYLRFRRTGTCAAAKAIRYAESCEENRSKNLCAAIIRAMTVAGFARDRIAERLGTMPINISIYQLLYFDIRHHLHHREWLSTVALPNSPISTSNHVAVKERVFLAAAYHGGAKRLEAAMTGAIPRDGDAEQMTATIRSLLTVRACEFLLENTQRPASEQDLARYLEFARLQPPTDRTKEQSKLNDFGARIRAAVVKKNSDPDATRITQSPTAERTGSFSPS